MQLSPALMLSWLTQVPAPRRIWVAYSGGCDSHALLHLMAALCEQLPCPVQAVHVHHGLQAIADDWVSHAKDVCAALNIPLSVQHVDGQGQVGDSPEAAARNARYQAFKQCIGQDELLLLAHHQQDQAETVLLQLLRGAGVDGLAAMPHHATFGQGWVGRPLLDVAQAAIRQYAQAHELTWIEDPSNSELGFNRNYLRHTLVHLLAKRWPAWASTLSRSASHLAEASGLLHEQAEADFLRVRGEVPGTLSVSRLLALSPARRQQVLRHVITRHCGLEAPDHRHMAMVNRALEASGDASPCVRWANTEVRRYRDLLYLLPQLGPHDPQQVLLWDLSDALSLPGQGQLVARILNEGARLALSTDTRVEVRFRHGGEVCQPAGRGHHHEVRKLMQEWGVPPWERDRVPFIYVRGQLAAIVGFCVCAPFAAVPGQMGVQIERI